jgi:hypothetical protein
MCAWNGAIRSCIAKPVDSGENLVVLIPDDDGVFYSGDGGTIAGNRMSCTNAVQTYADLYHCGGRGAEAAGMSKAGRALELAAARARRLADWERIRRIGRIPVACMRFVGLEI